jgi:hypothetical protein
MHLESLINAGIDVHEFLTEARKYCGRETRIHRHEAEIVKLKARFGRTRGLQVNSYIFALSARDIQTHSKPTLCSLGLFSFSSHVCFLVTCLTADKLVKINLDFTKCCPK